MVFSSLTFLYLFLPLNFLFYFLSKNKIYRNWILIIFSLGFYSWGEPVWISLLIFSSTIDYFHGLIAQKYRGKFQAKLALISSVVLNLSLLGFFKYSGFIADNINNLLNTNIPHSNFSLPIGISFYTFQTISYVIDVYKGDVKAQKSYYKFLLFVSLFHQLVAGPIVRYKDIASEIENRITNVSKFSEGINRFVIGLGKKVIFANTAGEISEVFLNGDIRTLPVLGAWFGISLFAIQIYFDFSGYSDMAIGLGRMFGFTYKENFNYPYISKSATEFWRRWHISLGSFFRDYIYIPLGGNRKLQVRNLFVVWFLTGLWHGASWNFIVWGLYYGILIFIEKIILLKILNKVTKFISHIYLIAAVLIGWVFFYFTDLSQAIEYIKVMLGFGNNDFVNLDFSIHFSNNIIFFIVALIACTPIMKYTKNMIKNFVKEKELTQNIYDKFLQPTFNFIIMIIITSLLVGQSYNPFLYFRF